MSKANSNDESSITIPVLGAGGRVEHRNISMSDLDAALERGPFREGGDTARLVTNAQGKKVLAL